MSSQTLQSGSCPKGFWPYQGNRSDFRVCAHLMPGRFAALLSARKLFLLWPALGWHLGHAVAVGLKSSFSIIIYLERMLRRCHWLLEMEQEWDGTGAQAQVI